MEAMARAGGGNHYFGDTADDLMEPFERELDLIARLVLRRLVLRVHAADGVQVSMVNILERSPSGGWRLADLAAGHTIQSGAFHPNPNLLTAAKKSGGPETKRGLRRIFGVVADR